MKNDKIEHIKNFICFKINVSYKLFTLKINKNQDKEYIMLHKCF